MSRDEIKEKSGEDIEVLPKEQFLPEKVKNSSRPVPIQPLQVYTKLSYFVSSLSIRYKIAGALILVLVIAIAALGMVTFSQQKRILEEEIKKRAGVFVHQLAGVGKEGIMTKDDLSVFSTIKEIQKHAGVVYAMVVDAQGAVFVHNNLTEKGKILSADLDRGALETNQLLFQQTIYNKEPIMDAALPIMVTYQAKSIRIGTARIGLSEKELQGAIARQKLTFFWISLAFVVIGFLIAVALSKVLTGPIYTLAVGMQIVAQGDLNQQVKVTYKDEIGKLTESFNQMVLSLREKLRMEKYLSNATLKSIRKARDNSKMKLGGERKYVTTLFSDVRGFTSMSEKMSPEEVVDVLNVYLNLQARIVSNWGGIVDKYVGDEIMAIFEGKGQEGNAVRAAIEIQKFCRKLNWARGLLGKKQMNVGIGLNSGDVIMGNMGSEEQMNYTVIGDNINLTERLCSVAQAGQVVISKVTADALGKEATINRLEPVKVKGKEKMVEVFEAFAITGVSRDTMRRDTYIEARYHMEGLPDEVNAATIRNLTSGGCIIESAVPLGTGSQLVLHINDEILKHLSEVRATVRHARKLKKHYCVGLSFEGLSEIAQATIIDWVHQVESEIRMDAKENQL
ncbi:MAG TPA: adenylate/guanylate cyclase domain-containing protein [Smithellaceae bacterium]|nr:adenylate/guanylate cyclase domain-containing protein [Smithellaceae bacterium]